MVYPEKTGRMHEPPNGSEYLLGLDLIRKQSVGPVPVISSVYVTLPRIPVTNEGLGWDSLLNMVHSPGAD